MTVFIASADLTARYDADGVIRLASATATLDASASARVAAVVDDVNAWVTAQVAGLTFDGAPQALIDIGCRVAAYRLWIKTWGTRSNSGKMPEGLVSEFTSAKEELEQFKISTASLNSTTAQQVAGRFSAFNVGDVPADTNPRATVRDRMKRSY